VGQRPTTAAYATEDDPFAQPMVDTARKLLEQGGIKTVSYQVYPSETTDYTPIAQKIIASKAQIVIFGSFLPDIVAYAQAFKQQHFNPQAIVASAGPDEGKQFTSAVGGTAMAEGIMNPSNWYAGLKTYQNTQMVQSYLAKYGGTTSDISVDSAEAYAVGQVLVQAANKIHSIDRAKLITELHSGDTFQSLQGPVKFDALGENIAEPAFIFQWQKGSFIPVYPDSVAAAKPEFPKTNWP
jgi:branched-chain amino acid transport system substrate-binding protein